MAQYMDLTYYKNLDNSPASLVPIRTNKRTRSTNKMHAFIEDLANSEYGVTIYNLFKSDLDYVVLKEYARKHGVFLTKYFQRDINIRVKKKILEDKIDLRKYYPLYCSQYSFGAFEQVQKHLPGNFALDFGRVAVYYLNDDDIFNRLNESYKLQHAFRSCQLCGKHFRVTGFPDWVYYGADGHKTVCFECPINEIPDKQRLLKLIPQLIEKCGFIPNSDFSPINHKFSARVDELKWTETVGTIFQMGHYREFFDSWFRALVEAGVLRDNVRVTSRGVKCIAKSGNECNSLDEQFIDNWLFANDLNPMKEPMYPKHPKYNPSGRRRADWLVKDYYVEYFGLAGEETYDKKTIEKMNLVRELDLKFIAIFPEDLNSLDTKLAKLRQ
jgi:hypothetical protein